MNVITGSGQEKEGLWTAETDETSIIKYMPRFIVKQLQKRMDSILLVGFICYKAGSGSI